MSITGFVVKFLQGLAKALHLVPADRRRHARFEIGNHATLIMQGDRYDCVIKDISAVGALVAGEFPPEAKEDAQLSHRDWGVLSGRIVRILPGEVAIEFDVDEDSARFALGAVLGRERNP